ncbi:MAG: DegV family protein [Chloroflexi bacterium]|nr:DegV family protein [Chloroflexota bacterium]
MAVHIVTDSTADIPPRTAAEFGVTVVPLTVHFGQQAYKEGLEISAEEFYLRLTTGAVLPRTSQPSAGDFAEAYRPLVTNGAEVLSIHLSSKLSGTHNSALLGRQQLLDEAVGAKRKSPTIEVVDTGQVSMALGLLILRAARMARAGTSLTDLVAWLQGALPRMRTFFVVQTLEYLARGGRIGRAQAFLGGLLNLKPILEIRDGVVEPLARVRTSTKAFERLAELSLEQAPAEEAVVAYTTEPDPASTMARRLQEGLNLPSVSIVQVGPVIGTYAGPGLLGAAVLRKEGAR